MNRSIVSLIVPILFALSTAANSQTTSTNFNFRTVVQPGTKTGSHTFTRNTTIDRVVLNDAGEFAFLARWRDGDNDEHAAIFTSKTVVVHQGEEIEGNINVERIDRHAFIAINADGRVAYEARFNRNFEDPGTSDGLLGIFIDRHLAIVPKPAEFRPFFTLNDDGFIIPGPLATFTPAGTLRFGQLPNARGEILIPINFAPSGFLILLGTPNSR